MKRMLIHALLWAALAVACLAQTAAPVRVLFLGNSLTDGNDVPELVKELAALQGITIEYDMNAPGGYALEDHWRDGMQRMLQTGRYQALVLQQGPSTQPDSQANLRQWVGTWSAEARRYGTEPMVYMVWPVRTQANGFALVSQSYRNAAQAAGARIFPAGEAWEEVMRQDSSIALYSIDDLHATPAGSFLAAMVIARGLIGLDPARVGTRVGTIILPEATVARFRSVVSTLPAGTPPGASTTPVPAGPTPADLTATYSFTTLAGAASLGSSDGAAVTARFATPSGVAVAANGDLFIADTDNDTVRKITPAGIVSTVAGSPGRPGVANGTGSAARLNAPPSIAADGAGNIYVADNSNSVVRKVTPEGVVTTLAGTVGARGSIDGLGAAARFEAPIGLAADAAGVVYVADFAAHTIRRIGVDGTVTTIAGTPGVAGAADATGLAARFNAPRAIAVSANGTLYVADRGSHTIRMISPAGAVTTLAGVAGASGAGDGTGSGARFGAPEGVAVEAAGNVFVADTLNHTIRRITPAGVVTTVAGAAAQAGSADGTGSAARFTLPEGIAVDANGNVIVADTMNHTIRRVTPAGVVTTVAGLSQGNSGGSADGGGAAARFRGPTGIALGPGGEVYVADRLNFTVRRVSPFGVVTTVAGRAGQPLNVTSDLDLFAGPIDVAVDASGQLYVADSNRIIRKVAPGGAVTGFVGNSAAAGPADGVGGAGRFAEIGGMVIDGAGNLFVTDRETVRRVAPTGEVTTIAGMSGASISADGVGTSARFGRLLGIALDAQGNLYVADVAEHTIRKISPSMQVTMFAGLPGNAGSQDGNGIGARFRNPSGVAVDATGVVFVADTGNELIRRISPTGDVTTIAGLAGAFGSADGVGSDARFSGPRDIAVDAAGHLYISSVTPDANVIRKGERVTTSTPTTPTGPTTPAGPTTPSTPSAGAGGGAISGWSMLALAVVWFTRSRRVTSLG